MCCSFMKLKQGNWGFSVTASLWPSPFLSIFAFSYFFIFLKTITFIHVPIVYVLFVLVIVGDGGGGCVCMCTNANPITCGIGVRNQLVGLVLYFHHAGPRD